MTTAPSTCTGNVTRITPCGTPATRLARRMGNGTMRIFIAVGLVTVGIFAAAGSLAPIAAQEGATAANPYNLPPTHFGSENPQAVHELGRASCRESVCQYV